MAEYIEREALLELIQYRLPEEHLAAHIIKKCVEITRANIKALPAADVVEVVRCKDCIHFRLFDGNEDKWCEIFRFESPVETGWCCYGERRIDEN